MADLKTGQIVTIAGKRAKVEWVGPSHIDLRMEDDGSIYPVRKNTVEYGSIKVANTTPFANGRSRAEQAIANKASAAGVKVSGR